MRHERFHYKTMDDMLEKERELGIRLPFAKDASILAEPVKIGDRILPNRMGIAPMEGADAGPDGSPSEYTNRRYIAAAKGGAAMIWFEAISIVEEGRSARTQLLLSEKNLDGYRWLTDAVKEAGVRANGFAPYLVMQANHSGRYSNPDNRPAPLIAYRHPELERYRAAEDSCVVSDNYLRSLEGRFAEAAVLARRAGFDAVDVKACHGYLLMELLSAYTRPGAYGGSYENRTRLLKNGIRAAKTAETPDFQITCRLGIYDGYAWPWGFGAREGQGMTPDLTEPVRLVRELREEEGLRFLNLTMGNPYATTHVTRPYDAGKYEPPEHPLEGIHRMIAGIGEVKRAVPEMAVFASAPSYLRQYADLYAAGAVEQGLCDGMLFGRLSFADPDFPNQVVHQGRIDPKRVCLTCGKCGDLIRAHQPTGCVVRNPEIFLPFYRKFAEEKASLPANFRG